MVQCAVDESGTFLKCGPSLLDVAGQVEELGEAKRQLEEVCQRNAELEMLLQKEHRRGEDLHLALSCEKERADKAEEQERERANEVSSKQHSAEQMQAAQEEFRRLKEALQTKKTSPDSSGREAVSS